MRAVAGSLQRTDREITELYQRHVDTVYRVCYSYMKNRADTEDMVQDTFIKPFPVGGARKGLAHRHCLQPVQKRAAALVAAAGKP